MIRGKLPALHEASRGEALGAGGVAFAFKERELTSHHLDCTADTIAA